MKVTAVLRALGQVYKTNDTRKDLVSLLTCERLPPHWAGGHPLIVDDTQTQGFCTQRREKRFFFSFLFF